MAIKGPTHPQASILLLFLSMSDIQRITLISDPTNEFRKNANNSFKERLPERLSLPGDQWRVSLLSMSIPDQGQSNGVIAMDPHTQVAKFIVTYLPRKYINGEYRWVSFQTMEYVVEFEDMCQTSCDLWQPVLETIDARSEQQDHAGTHVRTRLCQDR